MTNDWTGGCLCGAIRYRCQGEPLSMGLCQCTRCQRQSGSAFLMATVFPAAQVSFECGQPRVFTAYGDDGRALYRHFCGDCGSALMITLDRYPDIRSIMGGTLDDKSRLNPRFSLWSSEGQPWLTLPSSIKCHAEYPDGLIA